jgi:hypothetical protein
MAQPRYPIYVISKGRWESRLTVKWLEWMAVPYRLVVEPPEVDRYAHVVDYDNLLVLPFANLGQGSIPARNWVWEHALAEGHRRHWILDDNIDGFFRLHNNAKQYAADGTIFRAAEDWADRYTNVAMAGFQYHGFANHRQRHPPLILNTRIYSCILIQNDLPHRWRGRYNEDTDLSIRVLRDGWCTVLFYAFLARKMATMTMKGGNTEALYAIPDGRRLMAESLRAQHPDIVTIVEKWGRWQHLVDYSTFRDNALIRDPAVAIPDGPNEYGMVLEQTRIAMPNARGARG